MPISRMRMNVASQLLLQELALKANCNYNPEKEEIKEISKVSMQCLSNGLTERDNETDALKTNKKINNDKQQLQKFIFENSNPNNLDTLPKIRTFIPYPDHNYGQQPPLTPPAEPTSKVITVNNTVSPAIKTQRFLTEPVDEQGVTRCICGFKHDDGYMICCDDCSSWQHIDCMGIKSSKVPEKYSCHKCSPRELDLERAKAIQAKKRENMSEGDDDDEEEETASEDETGGLSVTTTTTAATIGAAAGNIMGQQTMYTAISNTPTRITLLSNSNNITSPQSNGKSKTKKGNRTQKKKLTDPRNTRSRKTKRKDKPDEVTGLNENAVSFFDNDSLTNFCSSYKLYEEIEVNRFDDELQNMQLKIPEAQPAIELNNIVKCHTVTEVSPNRKALLASTDIPMGNLVLEYKGFYLTKRRFEELNPILKESCPYVACYNDNAIQIVIDARTYGNDARFIRRSCMPNAELKHFMLNGLLHVMIISKLNILKDNEITIPFDYPIETYKGYIECVCQKDNCIVQQHNNEWKKLNSTQHFSSMFQNENSRTELQLESETESNAGESKHEKLSREDRKLQALMKQFEKLEKKQDVVKKVKEPKTPNMRSASVDENTNPGNPQLPQKPPLARKMSGTKRRSAQNARRRTRQSSCSSEPVSPNEQDINSAVSTPTTPLSNSHPSSMFEAKNMLMMKSSKKEPLTLTLPIQRKLRNEHSMTSPTPPGTPLPQSPLRTYTESSSLALSLDTQSLLESTPLKGGVINGLLQIAPTTPLSTSMCSSFGYSTVEEKIGDLTVRCGDTQPSPLSVSSGFHSSLSSHGGSQPRKYYGCMKKHWLRKFSASNSTTKPNDQSTTRTSMDQVSLAALVASLSHQRHMLNIANAAASPLPVFKRPKSCIPLKKRLLQRAVATTNQSINQHALNNEITTTATSLNHNNIPINVATTTAKSYDKQTINSSKLDIPPHHSNSLLQKLQELKSEPLELHTKPNTIPSMCISVKPETGLTIKTISSSNYYSINHGETHETILPSSSTSSKTDTSLSEPANVPTSLDKSHVSNSITTQSVKTTSTKRPFNDVNTSVQPSLKKQRTSSSSSNVSLDSQLKVVVTEPSQSNVKSSETHTEKPESQASVVVAPVQSVSEIKIESEPVIALTPPRKSISSSCSPRSSVDSNPDNSEQGSVGRKKLSYKEYRNRQRNQKSTSSSSNTTLHSQSVPLSNTDQNSKSVEDPATDSISTPYKQTLKLNQATAESLLTPRIVSLRESEGDVKVINNTSPDSTAVLNTSNNINDKHQTDSQQSDSVEPNESMETTTATTTTVVSVFEPVSPGNDIDSASPNPEDHAASSTHSIHSDITKNPFSIHTDITKNPFGKKQQSNAPAPGLLQFLSAQKYPHLTNLGSNENTSTSSSATTVSTSITQQQQQQYRGTEHDNDDDASSTHSNISSTSYGSTSAENPHDRTPYSSNHHHHHNHHRTYSRGTTEYATREQYYQNQQQQYNNHQYYQSYNSHLQQQQQHSRSNSSSQPTRTSNYTTNFQQQQQQASHYSSSRHNRPSTGSRGYPPYQ